MKLESEKKIEPSYEDHKVQSLSNEKRDNIELISKNLESHARGSGMPEA